MSKFVCLAFVLCIASVNCSILSSALEKTTSVAQNIANANIQGLAGIAGAVAHAAGAVVAEPANIIGSVGDAFGTVGHTVAKSANEVVGTTVVEENKVQVVQSQQPAPQQSNAAYQPGTLPAGASPQYPYPGYPTGNQYPAGCQYPGCNQYPTGNQYPIGNQYPNGNQYPIGNQYPSGNQYPNGYQYPTGNQYPQGYQYPAGYVHH